MIEPFNWIGISDTPNDFVICAWRKAILRAHWGGRWSIMMDGRTIVGDAVQVQGANINEAKQRAQAAALVLIRQLGQLKHQNHGTDTQGKAASEGEAEQ